MCGAEGRSEHKEQKWLKPLNPKSPRTARTLSGQFFGFNTIKNLIFKLALFEAFGFYTIICTFLHKS